MDETTNTVTVQIGKFSLHLSPLKKDQIPAAFETSKRLLFAVGKPMSEEWFENMKNAIGFIFLAAKKAHPDLTLTELYNAANEAPSEETVRAFDALGILTQKFYTGL